MCKEAAAAVYELESYGKKKILLSKAFLFQERQKERYIKELLVVNL
jgi:hypothetical protein